MLDDFNISKLPGFSNEPQQFAHMTLFVKGGNLYLHRSHPSSRFIHGVSVAEMADYYSNYVERETAGFMKLAEHQAKHLERSFEYLKKPKPWKMTEDRQDYIKKAAIYFAASWADNCDDNHDLSPEFCEATTKLGEALSQRAKAGFKTITIIDSNCAAKRFIDMPRLNF